MKKKIVISVVSLILLCAAAFVINALIGGWTSYDINKYAELVSEQNALPKLDELGKYDSIYFKYYHNNMLIFESDAYVLKLSYDDDNYQKEKNKLSQKYIYQTEPLSYIGNTKEPTFQTDSFDFKVLDVNKYDLFYPKELIFIGTSDKSKQIAYVYFYDFDIDSINVTFEEFLKEECGW